MTTVYLAGKMAGLTKEEMSEWRNQATSWLWEGFYVYDPSDTPLSENLTSREIVDSNKFQIRNSDLILVELNHDDVSIGTIGEIVFAREHGKPVVAWGGASKIVEHPWVQDHITIHFPDLLSATRYINKNYRKKCAG